MVLIMCYKLWNVIEKIKRGGRIEKDIIRY